MSRGRTLLGLQLRVLRLPVGAVLGSLEVPLVDWFEQIALWEVMLHHPDLTELEYTTLELMVRKAEGVL